MKSILVCSVVAISAVSLPASAEDGFSWGNITFQPRIYAGYADYEIKSEPFNSSFLELDGSTTDGRAPLQFALPSHSKLQNKSALVGIGGTVAVGQFFGDIYYQSTPNQSAYSATTETFEFRGVNYDDVPGEINMQHSDWATSLGYMVTSQWSVFTGYKSGNTEWRQVDQIYLQSNSELAFQQNINGQFDQDGPFLGTSYSFPVGSGVLTLKAAYAYLNGNYKWANSGFDPSGDPYIIKWDLDGNSNAYSLGVSWTRSINDNLGFSLGANYHKYKFDMSGTATPTVGNGGFISGQISGGSITEELFTLTAALYYRF